MFYTGTLQQGIAKALQESKYVVCFVTDGQDESRQWETEFLTDESIAPPMVSLSVCLRLVAGSQEERYLAQICPIPRKPTLVVIRDAELKEYISAGTTKADFIDRLKSTLQLPETASAPEQPATAVSAAVSAVAAAASQQISPPQPEAALQAAAAATTTNAPDAPAASPLHSSSVPAASSIEQTATSATPASTTTSDRNARFRSLMAERAARLSAQRAQQAESDASDAAARAQASTTTAPLRPPTAQTRHAEELRKRQREAREERARILKAIEDDKAARRARQAERQQQLAPAPTSPIAAEETTQAKSSGGGGGPCNIQVRLFDGSNIRRRFDGGKDTLRGAVRAWVDGEAGADGGAYGFKVLLGPVAPNRVVEEEDEGKTLGDLGLTPSATLMLVRSVGNRPAVRAYPGAGGNVVTRFVLYVLACATGLLGLIAAFFRALVGGASMADRRAATATAGEPARAAGATEREERRGEQQFYNGNSTNFEPRHDDDVET